MRPSHELHVHLYGCAPAEDLWELAKHQPRQEQRIQWYKDEFLKAYGRPSRFDDFWTNASGADLLRQEYEYTEPGAFTKFQASINLPIALFPLSTEQAPLLEQTVRAHAREGLSYVEYRLLLPHYFSPDQRKAFLSMMALTAQRLEKEEQIAVRLIYSIARDDTYSTAMYTELRQWLHKHPDLAVFVTGIDFCASECGHTPQKKRDFLRKVHDDNKAYPELALAMLYHVGETFEHLWPESTMRWVWQAQEFGAHRLGHAVAVGVNPLHLVGKEFDELVADRKEHLRWLMQHAELLERYSYRVDLLSIRKELDELNKQAEDARITCRIDASHMDDLAALQKAVRTYLKSQHAIIETCPTSNKLIAHIAPLNYLPAISFLNDDMTVCIGADDPGIFATTLAKEFSLCENLGVARSRLQKISDYSAQLSAEALVRKKLRD